MKRRVKVVRGDLGIRSSTPAFAMRFPFVQFGLLNRPLVACDDKKKRLLMKAYINHFLDVNRLSRMWEVMSECHKLQLQLISSCHKSGNIKLNMHSEFHRQVTSHLEDELTSLASSFTKWITGQKTYIQAINDWLVKCVALPQRSSKRKRRAPPPVALRNYGPPIYATCGIWLEKLEALPTKEVSSSVKGLASDVAKFLPRQEKKRVKKHRSGDGIDHILEDERFEDCGPGLERFRTSLEGFVGQLNRFAELSVKMYEELKEGIGEAKNKYEQLKAYSQGS